MKKTLTVNLGGTVFHIDEDAYRLLDNYLMNLKHHFRKQEGAEEIVNDIENRISELFSEKISKGQQVITLIDAEEVIHRMGKPEDLSDEEPSKQEGSSEHGGYHHETYSQESGSPRRRLFRNPDDKVVGGVLGGIAAYLKVNVSALRLIVILLLIFGVGTLIPVYIVCWIVIPEATTAAEKLSRRN
jgi:phage shock protein PspC (stress-responsive transcriptional regulator)